MRILEQAGEKPNNGLVTKVNRENLTLHLLQYELRIVGKTLEDAQANPEWFREFTICQEAYDEFKGYAIPLMKKIFKCNKAIAEKNFGWFDLQFGLKVE